VAGAAALGVIAVQAGLEGGEEDATIQAFPDALTFEEDELGMVALAKFARDAVSVEPSGRTSTAPTLGLGEPAVRCSGTDCRMTSMARSIIRRGSGDEARRFGIRAHP